MTPDAGILKTIREMEAKGIVGRLASLAANIPEARAALKRLADRGNGRARDELARLERPAKPPPA